jgi:hypothetical protein
MKENEVDRRRDLPNSEINRRLKLIQDAETAGKKEKLSYDQAVSQRIMVWYNSYYFSTLIIYFRIKIKIPLR